jgi:hypothetical protein
MSAARRVISGWSETGFDKGVAGDIQNKKNIGDDEADLRLRKEGLAVTMHASRLFETHACVSG